MSFEERLERKLAEARKNQLLYEENKSKDSIIWAGTVDIPPDEIGTNYLVYLANRSNGPCIYEYAGYSTNWWGGKEPNSRVTKLSFPNEGRNYYKVGDKIMPGEYTEQTLSRMFRSLPRIADSKIGWTDVLWHFLNEGESQKYKIYYKIVSIRPDGRGGGKVSLKGVIRFEGYDIELEEINTQNQNQLSDSFNFKIRYSYADTMTFISKVVVNVSIGALKSAGGKPAKELARLVITKAARRKATSKFSIFAAKILKKKITAQLANGIKTFCVTMAKEMNNRMREAEFYAKVSNKQANWAIIEPSVRRATQAFVEGLIAEELSEALGKQLQTTMFSKFSEELVTKIVVRIQTAGSNIMLNTLNNAADTASRTNRPFSKIFEKKLYDEFQSQLKTIFTKDLPGLM